MRVFFYGSLVGALLVNPWNTRALTEAIITALTMDDEEKKARYAHGALPWSATQPSAYSCS